MIERSALLVPEAAPRHIAVVMDGTRSWCNAHALPAADGYRRSTAALEAVVADAIALGIEALTVFVASDERTSDSCDFARRDVCRAGDAAIDALGAFGSNISVRLIGRRDRLPPHLADAVTRLETATAGNPGLRVALAIDYSARREIAEAARSLASEVEAGRLSVEAIDDVRLGAALATAGVPDPDLFIRTGGGLHMADALLYQCAYTELWATPTAWPDFTAGLLRDAIAAYGKRQRRFGR